MAGQQDNDAKLWVIMVVAVAFTLVMVAIVIRLAPVDPPLEPYDPNPPETLGPKPIADTGVDAAVTAGDQRITKAWEDLDFTLTAGESLDDALPAGPFTATFNVRFEVQRRREARIGAEHYGGTLLVRRGEEVLVSDYADPPEDPADGGRLALSDYETFTPGVHSIEYRFERDGDSPARLRAIWQPIDAREPSGLF